MVIIWAALFSENKRSVLYTVVLLNVGHFLHKSRYTSSTVGCVWWLSKESIISKATVFKPLICFFIFRNHHCFPYVDTKVYHLFYMAKQNWINYNLIL